MSNIIERFKNEEIAVHCKTESQAKEFIDICHDNDMKWSDEVKELNWEKYKEKTCYGYARIGKHLWYGTEWGFRDDVDKIITFDEFMEEYKGMKQFTKDDLKSGMIVVLRDGSEYVVIKDIATVWTDANPYGVEHETNDIIVNGNRNCWEYLDNYNDDLTSAEGYDCSDIMQVYLASHPCCMQKLEYELKKRSLLWEREEVKELTVEEISKLLGYKVRVVGGKD